MGLICQKEYTVTIREGCLDFSTEASSLSASDIPVGSLREKRFTVALQANQYIEAYVSSVGFSPTITISPAVTVVTSHGTTSSYFVSATTSSANTYTLKIRNTIAGQYGTFTLVYRIFSKERLTIDGSSPLSITGNGRRATIRTFSFGANSAYIFVSRRVGANVTCTMTVYDSGDNEVAQITGSAGPNFSLTLNVVFEDAGTYRVELVTESGTQDVSFDLHWNCSIGLKAPFEDPTLIGVPPHEITIPQQTIYGTADLIKPNSFSWYLGRLTNGFDQDSYRETGTSLAPFTRKLWPPDSVQPDWQFNQTVVDIFGRTYTTHIPITVAISGFSSSLSVNSPSGFTTGGTDVYWCTEITPAQHPTSITQLDAISWAANGGSDWTDGGVEAGLGNVGLGLSMIGCDYHLNVAGVFNLNVYSRCDGRFGFYGDISGNGQIPMGDPASPVGSYVVYGYDGGFSPPFDQPATIGIA